MVYCADCGEKLYYCTANNFEKRQDFFECSTHRKNDEKCKSYYIRAVVLEDMVWIHMETVISYILHYEDHFRVVVQEQLKIESDEKIQAWRKQLTQAEKRIAELDRLFVKIYEDNAKGKLSDERFSMMSGNYEAEQKKLRMDAVELQKNIEEQDRQNERLEIFIQKAKHYQDLNSLTPDALRDMVSAICRCAGQVFRQTSAENRNLLRWCRIYSAKFIDAKRNSVTEVTPYSPRKSGFLIFLFYGHRPKGRPFPVIDKQKTAEYNDEVRIAAQSGAEGFLLRPGLCSAVRGGAGRPGLDV